MNMPETNKNTIRMEVVRTITELLKDRDARDRLDKGVLSHTKGREHWILHLMLTALDTLNESSENGFNYILTTTNTIYKEMGAKIENVNKEINGIVPKLKDELETAEKKNYEQIVALIDASFDKLNKNLEKTINDTIGKTAEAIGAQALETKNLTQTLSKDVADTFKVSTQVRLLISENMRKLNEISEIVDKLSTEGAGAVQTALHAPAPGTQVSAGEINQIVDRIATELKDFKNFEERIDVVLKGVNKHIDLTSIETHNRIEILQRNYLELARRVENIAHTVDEIKTSIEALRALILEKQKL
jgi:methyl-accepting chemotaxis protein